jgi:hypothetical protein
VSGDLATWVGDFFVATVGAPPAVLATHSLFRRNANSWLRLLNDAGGITIDDLREALESRPAAAELFTTALEAASKTAQQQRHRLLAGIVAAGLKERDAELDALLVLEQAAERLTDAHVRLLLLIEANPQEIIAGTPGGPAGVTDEYLTALWPVVAELVVPLRSSLLREGLIRDIAVGSWEYHGRWVIDAFGTRLLNHYRAIGGVS